MVLIDLDACVSFEEGEVVGAKYSSAYIPPEMVYIYETQIVTHHLIRSSDPKEIASEIEATEKSQSPYERVKASAAYDMWSFGITFFEICSGKPLFLAENEGNISGMTS